MTTTRTSARPRILVVDDDAALAEMLELVLAREGFDTSSVGNGSHALAAYRRYQPELVLLDLMLPGRNGIDLCRDIRAESGVPIIMLTAKSDTADVVQGLEVGADDYVSKPFKVQELMARIRARLRRPDVDTPEEPLTIGDISINVLSHTVWRGNQEISLTPLEFDLLHALFRRPNQVFSRELLLQEVWGYYEGADTRLVNVHVQRLRSKIEQDPEHPEIVITVRGIGYRTGGPSDNADA